MIDGEGTVNLSWSGGSASRWVAIHNTDLALIEAIEAALAMLDIKARRRSVRAARWYPNAKPLYQVTIGQQAQLRRLRDVAPPRAPAKRAKLDAILASYKYAQFVPEDERPIALITELYEQGYVVPEIAERVGVRPSRIARWMKIAGIKRPGSSITRLRATARRCPETLLREMYFQREMGLTEMSLDLGISLPTLRRLFKSYGIQQRTRGEATRLGHLHARKQKN